MKKCPQCNRTYSDDTLSFCLEDGALLSASYDHSETQSPTVAMNAPEIPPTVAMPEILPTVASNVAPTVAAQEIPTVVAHEIPTVVAERPRETQTAEEGVRWYIYLAGFFIGFIYHIVMIRVLSAVLRLAGFQSFFQFDAIAVTMTAIIFGSLGAILGFIWYRAKWKWGLVIVWSELLVFLDFYYRSRLSVGLIIGFFFLTAFACAASWLGSFVRRKISNA